MAVNVKSIYWSIPAVVPALQERGGGSIINIASIGAMRPRPGLVWYACSLQQTNAFAKFSQVQRKQSCCRQCKNEAARFVLLLTCYQATKGLAAEYGKDGIRVNALCPLLSATPLFESFVGVPATEENIKKFLFNVPLGTLT